MNLVEQTRDWLSNNHITVPDDWLQACVEWIQEENQGRNLSSDDIQSLVYEQWLLSDLHELEVECLPNDVTSAAKFELSGTYALQVDTMLDVGLSYYSQQQKIKGTENANAKVSAEEPTYKPWEQKPSRMLMFKLTDGKQVVQGMEYRPISCLTPQTQPGTKVLIHGRILCRYGVLMLGEANIKNLGGEVDTLVEANSVINLLPSAMETNAELASKHHRQEFQGSEVRNNKTDIKQSQAISGQYNQTQGNSRQQTQGNNRLPSGNQSKIKTETMSQRGTGNNTKNMNSYSSQQNAGGFDDHFIEDIDFDDDFDDDFEEACMQTFNSSSKNKSNPQQQLQTGTNRQKNNQSDIAKNRIQGRVSDSNRQVVKSSQSTNQAPSSKPVQRGNQQQCEYNSGYRNSGVNKPVKNESVSKNSATRNETVPTTNQSDPWIDDMDDDFEDDVDLFAAAEAEMLNKQRELVKNTSSITGNIKQSAHAFTDQRGNKQGSTMGKGQSTCTSSGDSSNTPATSVFKTEETTDPSLKRGTTSINRPSSIVEPPVPSKIQKIKEAQLTMLKTPTSLDVENEYPFTYLSKMMSAPLGTRPTYHTVKAYISTLTGKLSSQDNRWTLSCKINDGTLAVDVDLSTKVLTEMIGFSPQQAQEMKKQVSKDPSIKEILKKGLQQCQQKLIDLICLMELEMSTSNAKPVIVATKQLTSNNADMLYNRVMSNWDKLNQ